MFGIGLVVIFFYIFATILLFLRLKDKETKNNRRKAYRVKIYTITNIIGGVMNYKNLNDFELVKQFQNGHTKVFEEILRRYKKNVFTYIKIQVKDSTIAHDIFQDTFLKVIKSLKANKYNHEDKFLAWVIRIAHNLIIDYFRKKNKLNTISNERENVDLFNLSRFSDHTIEHKMDVSQIHQHVKDLLKYLPKEQKEVVILRHFTGMSFREIAEQTDVSINTALGRMRYALINLRRLIKEKQLDMYL